MTLDPKHVEEIHHVSHGIFSIARHYGGCKVQGVYYVYDYARDVLIREDVHLARLKAARANKPKKPRKRKDQTDEPADPSNPCR